MLLVYAQGSEYGPRGWRTGCFAYRWCVNVGWIDGRWLPLVLKPRSSSGSRCVAVAMAVSESVAKSVAWSVEFVGFSGMPQIFWICRIFRSATDFLNLLNLLNYRVRHGFLHDMVALTEVTGVTEVTSAGVTAFLAAWRTDVDFRRIFIQSHISLSTKSTILPISPSKDKKEEKTTSDRIVGSWSPVPQNSSFLTKKELISLIWGHRIQLWHFFLEIRPLKATKRPKKSLLQ